MYPIRLGSSTTLEGFRARALALTTTMALLLLALTTGVASADGGRDHRDAENTFTKWVTAYPNMAGVVGGDVGDGTYAGEILTRTATDTSVVIDADYHFHGSTHSFSARVHVVQTGLTPGSTAVITGRVTEGWLKGNLVAGGYTQTTCPGSPAAGNKCFQGTLDILRGTKSED